MKPLFEKWREYLKEKKISVEDIHKRAEELDIPWDGDAQFMNWT